MKRYLLLMLPLALAACTKPAQDATPAATAEPAAVAAVETPPVDAGASLPGYHWQLTDAKGADGKRIDGLFVRADSPVQLDFADGRVSVSNTCNRMSGGYTLEADKLTFTPMASTMMACEDAVMDAENAFLQALESVTAGEVDGDTLTLTTLDGETLVFTATA